MAYDQRQSDFFAEASPPPRQELRAPPYSLEELDALGRQLAAFDRIPDDWIAGWWDMHERAFSTVRRAPPHERTAIWSGLFFTQVDRLMRVESEEQRVAEGADPAARERREPKRSRRRG